MLEVYAELEIQRRHLIEQKTPQDRMMVMAGIDRLLDQMIEHPPYIRTGEDIPVEDYGNAV